MATIARVTIELGDLVDFGSSVWGALPDFGNQAVLKRTENGFELQVRLPSGFDFEAAAADSCMGWFIEVDGNQMRDSSTGCPETLSFEAEETIVTLLDCRAGSIQLGIGRSIGLVRASAAVVGTSNVELNAVSGVTTDIPAAFHWSGLSSIEVTRSDNRPIDWMSVKAVNGSPMVLTDAPPTTELTPRWGVTIAGTRTEVTTRQWVEVGTSSDPPLTLEDHLDRHDRLLQLIEIAAGTACGYNGMWVLGESGTRNEYVHSGRPTQRPTDAPQRFMFNMDDLPTDALDRWTTLRGVFRRGLDPLLTLITAPPLHIETATMLLGASVEQIGATILREQDPDLEKNPTLRASAEAIIGEITIPILHDEEGWCADLVSGYNGIKHPDRDEPDSSILAKMLGAGIVLLRAWVATRVGCNEEALRRGVASVRVYGTTP